MTWLVDYNLEDGQGIQVETYATAKDAERRARFLSRKHHSGGYDGPCVYVFRSHNPHGQRVFFAGLINETDSGYRQDMQADLQTA